MKIYRSSVVNIVAVALTLTAFSAPADAVTVLTFEGVGDRQPIANFYNGGAGGNLGITMSPNSLAIVDADAGGTGNFGGEPSSSTALFFLNGTSAVMNVADGFDTGFSFFYTAIVSPGSLHVFDGLDGTGNLLTELILPLTPFSGAPDPSGQFSPFLPIGVAFDGIARSISFAGVQNQIAFDDVTFGSVTPGEEQPGPGGVVPLPGSFLLLAAGTTALGVARRARAYSR